MESLAFLSSDSPMIIKAILGLFSLFFFFSLLLMIRGGLSSLLKVLSRRVLVDFSEDLMGFLSHEERLPENKILYRRFFVRNYLIKISKTIRGAESERIRKVYTSLGFFRKDLLRLRYGTQLIRSDALARLRSLEFSLSDQDWFSMTQSSLPSFRWAAMEYLIRMKRESSFLWLARFLIDTDNRKHGITQHLLCCTATVSPDLVLMIFNYTDDLTLKDECLKTLAVYPHPKAELSLINYISDGCSNDSFSFVVKALGGSLTPRVIQIFTLSVEHPNWEVRKAIAESLYLVKDPKAYEILFRLSEDMNYLVRVCAIQSLVKNEDSKEFYLKRIKEDKEHPSYEILTHLFEKEGLVA